MDITVPQMSVQKPHCDERCRDPWVVVVRHQVTIELLHHRNETEAKRTFRQYRQQGYKLFNPLRSTR